LKFVKRLEIHAKMTADVGTLEELFRDERVSDGEPRPPDLLTLLRRRHAKFIGSTMAGCRKVQELVDRQFLAQACRGLCGKMRRMMSAEISHATVASFKDWRIFLGCIIMSKCFTGTMCEVGIRSGKGIFRH
jgi:hypothetical protein